ncbi:MAG: hypothetical protein AB1452_04365 [Pseudomonadota bacterium]
MTEEKKKESPIDSAQLEHLAKLADDRWREYENKSRAEWKLSYSVWATLLAATAALLTKTQDILECRSTLLAAAIAFAVAAFAIHWWFLDWVHGKLGCLRKEMNKIVEKRRALLKLEGIAQADAESGRQSMRVQLFITVLLGALLVGVAYVVPT